MSTKNSKKASKFVRCMSFPLRALIRARDLYVESMTGCAGHVSIGNAMGLPVPDLSRSFSTNSNYSTREEDLRELIRVASIRSRSSSMAPTVPRSKSVAIGRIDEHKPVEFGGATPVPKVFSRSRSYAVSKKSTYN